MRSHLTRNVFRCLLSNEPFIFRCPYQTKLYHRRHQRDVSRSAIRPMGRRTFLGMGRRPKDEQKEAQLDPGLSAMVELSVRQRLNVQLPPRDKLVKAWKDFFLHKVNDGLPVNSMQAAHALATYKHLRGTQWNGDEGLGPQHLVDAFRALKIKPEDDTKLHVELARLIYEDSVGDVSSSQDFNITFEYVEVLTRMGHSIEAKDIVLAYVAHVPDPSPSQQKRHKHLCLRLSNGFAEEDNEAELLSSIELAEDTGESHKNTIKSIMVGFYAARNDFEGVKKWYGLPKSDGTFHFPTTGVLKTVLQFSIRNGKLDWCRDVFRNLLANDPPKVVWDVILQWAAGALGKGVEDVEKLMHVMIRTSPEDGKPNAETINGLVALASSLRAPYLAERYISLGQKFGIRPNARTYILQMEYRADARDLRGARAAYELLQGEVVKSNEDLPAINKYIRAICSAKVLDYDQIVVILSDLTERDQRLEAKTTAALAKMYMHRHQNTELINLCQTESYFYTFKERKLIRKEFMDFCLNPETETDQSWLSYTVLHPIFDETTVEERTRLMTEYFRRGRSDMATHVFGHMRAHALPQRKPVLDTYIQCFLGIASLADREALDMVHNMLKLDSNIEPNTALYNSLMLVFTACDDARRAMNFWDDITNSREGPSYRSLEIVFWVCQKLHYGETQAKEIWDKMRKMEIEITGRVFSAYAGALAGNRQIEEAKKLCVTAPKELDLKVDMLTLGTMYNAIPNQDKQDDVAAWAKEKYPGPWAELEALGRSEDEEGRRTFNMKREFKA